MRVDVRGDEMRDVNESNDLLFLYISADDSVQYFEKGDGRFVLDYALLFKKWDQFSNDWEQMRLQSKSWDFLARRFGELHPAKDNVTFYFLYKDKDAKAD